jgi:DNA-3-methyladenine glycosylase I
MKKRCLWVDPEDTLSCEYHDCEWGVPLHDDRKLFEFLVLEGAQAGLNWMTILRKRENFRKAFDDFVPEKVARYDGRKIAKLLADPGIIRNRRKIEAAITNAKAFLEVQKKFGSFDSYTWSFVGGKPVRNEWRRSADIPVFTTEAQRMSEDLLKRGFKFVGPTICYAHMQAAGMVNDHLVDCYRYKEIARIR